MKNKHLLYIPLVMMYGLSEILLEVTSDYSQLEVLNSPHTSICFWQTWEILEYVVFDYFGYILLIDNQKLKTSKPKCNEHTLTFTFTITSNISAQKFILFVTSIAKAQKKTMFYSRNFQMSGFTDLSIKPGPWSLETQLITTETMHDLFQNKARSR